LLGQYVGTSREIVTHYMNMFRRQGYVRYSRKGIVLFRDAFNEWLCRTSTHAVEATQAQRATGSQSTERAVLKRA